MTEDGLPELSGTYLDQDDLVTLIEELVEEGETDAGNGGVPLARLSEESTFNKSTILRNCEELVEEGELEVAHGFDPQGHPRRSFLPAEEDKETVRQRIRNRGTDD